MEIERNSKQAEIEIVRNELDKYKTEMESLEKENRKLENKIQRQLLQASPKPEDEANFAVSGLLEWCPYIYKICINTILKFRTIFFFNIDAI